MQQAAEPPEPARDDASVRPVRGAFSRHAPGLLLAIGLAICTVLLLPPGEGFRTPVYDIGSVADETVIAPFAFQVPRPAVDVARERERLAAAVPHVFVFDSTALDSVRSRIAAFASALDTVRPRDVPAARDTAAAHVASISETFGVTLTPAEAGWLAFPSRRSAAFSAVRRTFERTLPDGVAASRALDGVSATMRIQMGENERTVRSDAVASWSDVLRAARLLHPDASSAVADGAYQRLLSGLFVPSLRFDSVTTEARRAEAVSRVQPWRFEVRSGEKIIGAHEVVREEDRARLEALRDVSLAGTSFANQSVRTLGTFLLNLAVIAIFVVTLAFYRPEIYARPRALAVIAACVIVVLIGAAMALRGSTMPGSLVPIGVAALLISILFDSRIALVCALVLAVLLGVQPVFRGSPVLFFVLAGGAAAAFSVRALERRTQFVWSIVAVAASYAGAAVISALAFDWAWSDVLQASIFGAINAVVSVALAMALLPPAEEACGVDTYVKLLEWSDLNRPLLRRLAVEAPGTWAHTLAMANLVEAAAQAVGANALLARVGTYYHDIGKLGKPGYFVENQASGRNPHDKLKPAASASIIRNHVRDGLALAAQAKVPRSVRAFIAEHHGTGPITYFLEKARERDASAHLSGEFMYPGPAPQSVETAICMLADGVEAASRVLVAPSEERLRETVETIVRSRIESGQLREAPITLQQLETVKSEFVRVLLATRHGRIDYPGPEGISASPRTDPSLPAFST
jgi:putative nucleotidyltransferase with HDIG domain